MQTFQGFTFKLILFGFYSWVLCQTVRPGCNLNNCNRTNVEICATNGTMCRRFSNECSWQRQNCNGTVATGKWTKIILFSFYTISKNYIRMYFVLTNNHNPEALSLFKDCCMESLAVKLIPLFTLQNSSIAIRFFVFLFSFFINSLILLLKYW